MSGDVPQFPGKGGVGGGANGAAKPTQPVPKWKTAICPFLTAGELSRQPVQTIVQTAGAQPPQMKAQACLGPQCMLFVGAKMQDGSELTGCAPAFQVSQMNGLNMMVSEFIMAARLGAEAEAREHAGVPPPVPTPSPLTNAADAATQE